MTATFYPVEHVLAINLEKDAARMERVQRQAAEFGIPISRVPAIYGKELDVEYVQSFLGSLTAFFQNRPNVVGCALSHMRAWRRIVEEGWECALIVEDDFTFTDGIRKYKKGVTLPKDWSVLYLGHSRGKWPRNPCSRVPTPDYGVGKPGGPVVVEGTYAGGQPVEVIQFVSERDAPMGCWGYVMRRSACEWCLARYRINEPVDVFLSSDSTLSTLQVLGVLPIVITHCYEFGSSTSFFRQNTAIKDGETPVPTGSSPAPAKKRSRLDRVAFVVISYIIYITIVNLLGIPRRVKIYLDIIGTIIHVTVFVMKWREKRMARLHEKGVETYGLLPGTYGEHYFDPFANVWNPISRSRVRELLQTVVDACPSEVVLMFGSLLGWARHQQMIPWDDDCDVLIDGADRKVLETRLRMNDRLIFSPGGKGDFDAKVSFKDGVPIDGVEWTWPFVDLYYTNERDEVRVSEKRMLKLPMVVDPERRPHSRMRSELALEPARQRYLPTRPVVFEGVELYVPVEYEYILSELYGKGWREMCVSSGWCHRLETPIDRQYQQTIACAKLDM